MLPLPNQENMTVGLLYAVFLLQDNVRQRQQNRRAASSKRPLLVAGSGAELSKPAPLPPRAAAAAEGACFVRFGLGRALLL